MQFSQQILNYSLSWQHILQQLSAVEIISVFQLLNNDL